MSSATRSSSGCSPSRRRPLRLFACDDAQAVVSPTEVWLGYNLGPPEAVKPARPRQNARVPGADRRSAGPAAEADRVRCSDAGSAAQQRLRHHQLRPVGAARRRHRLFPCRPAHEHRRRLDRRVPAPAPGGRRRLDAGAAGAARGRAAGLARQRRSDSRHERRRRHGCAVGRRPRATTPSWAGGCGCCSPAPDTARHRRRAAGGNRGGGSRRAGAGRGRRRRASSACVSPAGCRMSASPWSSATPGWRRWPGATSSATALARACA